MYAALWRILPGPVWLRVVILVILAAVALTACVLWLFPFLQEYVFPQDVTVQE